MTENIYDLANNLERAVRKLPEFVAVEQARQAIKKDETAEKLWQDYIDYQGKLQQLAQSGQMPTQEDQEKIQSITKQIDENELVRAFFMAQQSLSVYLNDLEKIIFQPVTDVMK